MPKYAETGRLTVLRPVPAWRVRKGGRERALDARLPALLHAIARLGTLAAAARDAGIPYRTAWAVLDEAARDVGLPLADLARGRGAALTPHGQRLLAAHDAAQAALASVEAVRLHTREADARPRTGTPLKVAASHDIALAQLRDRWRLAHDVLVEFHGSAESLDAYRNGAADVGGFHVEEGAATAADPLLARLDPARDALVSFITRTQGLIVPKGNPRRIRALRDLADRGLAIVNRQAGSGTRLLLDRLLARDGIAPSRLRGYTTEEFTHAAVAATVAAGRADAALGIEAAAAQFGLAFVPLARERYRFVCRRRDLESPAMLAFRALLASRATRAVVAPLPGYALDRPGEPVA